MIKLYKAMTPDNLSAVCGKLGINPSDLDFENTKILFAEPTYTKNTREISISIVTAHPANTRAFAHFLLTRVELTVYVRHNGQQNPVALKVNASNVIDSEATQNEEEYMVTAVVNVPAGVLVSPDEILDNLQEQSNAHNKLAGRRIKMDFTNADGTILDDITVLNKTTKEGNVEIESSGLKIQFAAKDKIWRSQDNPDGTKVEGWDYTLLLSCVLLEVKKFFNGTYQLARAYIEVKYYNLPATPCPCCLTCPGAHPESHDASNCPLDGKRCMGCYATRKDDAGMRNDLAHFNLSGKDPCKYLQMMVANDFSPPLPAVTKPLGDFFPDFQADEKSPAGILYQNVLQTKADKLKLHGSTKRKADEDLQAEVQAFTATFSTVSITTCPIDIHITALTTFETTYKYGRSNQTPTTSPIKRQHQFPFKPLLTQTGQPETGHARRRSKRPRQPAKQQPKLRPTCSHLSWLTGLRSLLQLQRLLLHLCSFLQLRLLALPQDLQLQLRRLKMRLPWKSRRQSLFNLKWTKRNVRRTMTWKWMARTSSRGTFKVSQPYTQWGPLLYAGVNKPVWDALLITVYTTHNTSYLQRTFIGQRRPLPCYEPPSRRPRPPRVSA